MASKILEEIREAVDRGDSIAELQVLLAQNFDALESLGKQEILDFYQEMGGPGSDYDAALIAAVVEGESQTRGGLATAAFGDPESKAKIGFPPIGSGKVFKAFFESGTIFGKNFASKVLQSLEGGLAGEQKTTLAQLSAQGGEVGGFQALQQTPGLLGSLASGLSRLIYGPRGSPISRIAGGQGRTGAIAGSTARAGLRVGGSGAGLSIISQGIRGIDFSNIGTAQGGTPLTPEQEALNTGAGQAFREQERDQAEFEKAETLGRAEVVGNQIPRNLPDGFNVLIVDHTGQFGTPGRIYIVKPSELELPFGGSPPGAVSDVGNTTSLGGDAEVAFAEASAEASGGRIGQDDEFLEVLFPEALGDIGFSENLFIPSRARTTDIPDRVEGGEGITQTGPASVEIKTGAAISSRAFTTFEGRTLLEWASIAAQRHGIPLNLLYGLVSHESDWNRNAVGKAAERGLVQIYPVSWPGITAAQAFNPKFALEWAAEKLRQRFNQYGSWEIAIAAHNSPVAAAHLAKTGEFQDAKSSAYVNDILDKANKSGLGNNIWDVGEFGPGVSPAGPEFAPFQTPDPAQSREFVEATYDELLGRSPTEDEYVLGVKRLASLAREAYGANIRIGQGSESQEVDPGAQFTQEIKGTGEFAFTEDVGETDDFTDFAAGVARLLQQGV